MFLQRNANLKREKGVEEQNLGLIFPFAEGLQYTTGKVLSHEAVICALDGLILLVFACCPLNW